ncbi:MAG: hypothetical protein ACKVVP_21905 [Chloroflexota bacterium]
MGIAPAEAPPRARQMTTLWLALLALSILGALPRLAAVRFNIWPHGDVLLDAAIAESLAWTGRLLVPIVDVRYYPTSQFGFGYPPDQHPPLWPLLGASLTPLLGDGYLALKAWSFTVGVLVIPLSFLAFRPSLGNGAALWLAGLVASTYLLIDFSGNGSLWILITAFYLLFIWRASAAPITLAFHAAELGIIIGLAFLVNYPAVILAPALLLTVALQHGRGALAWPVLRGVLIASIAAFLVVLPWFAFNASIHGNPLWSQPLERQFGGGAKQVDVRVVQDEVVKVNRPEAASPGARLQTTAANLYGNVGFLARQMLALAPVLNGFAAAALVALTLAFIGRGSIATGVQARSLAPIVAVLLCHAALALLWPTTKFRYLVPLLPLVLGLGVWLLSQIEPRPVRTLLRGVSTAAVVIVSAWTWLVIPSHTYYYNGGVVTDNFGQQGETVWMTEARQVARAAEIIRDRGPGTILGDHLFYALARQPIVINSAAYPRDVLETLVARYQVRYVWLEQGRLDETRQWLGGTLLHEDGRFALLELR